ncbi:MAG: aspartyl protease family protein [Fimbriimonadaceae bacterium]
MLSLALSIVASSSQEPTVGQVLHSVRQVVGYAAVARAANGIELTGKGTVSGTDGTFRIVFTPDGRYYYSQQARLGSTRAWDGKNGWESDPSGATIAMHLSELQYQHSILWVLTHEWLDPEGPFVIALADTEQGGDTYTLNLKPKAGHLKQKVTIDRETWLPTKNTFSIGDLDYTMEFLDWQIHGGYKMPGKIVTREGELEDEMIVGSVTKMRSLDPALFKRPAWSVTRDTVYDRSKQGTVESKLLFTGHIAVHPTIGGKDVGWFLLDSGAGGMVIDSAAAKELGAERYGELNVGGVGGVLESGYYDLSDFTLGPATVKKMRFIDLDLGQIGTVFGVKIAGIVGFDFFRRAVVEVDVEDGRVAVFSPHMYGNSRAGWERLILDGKHPTATAEFENGYTGIFRLDTGANGTVTFNIPTVEKHKLLDGRVVTETALGGVGGMVPVKQGKIKYFTLGGKRFENVTSIFAYQKQGLFDDGFLDGNIGQDLLKPFRAVFDYPNERLALVLREAETSSLAPALAAR